MQFKLVLHDKDKEQTKEVLKKERDKVFQPTWAEVWFTGYTRPTGSHKKGIFQTVLTDKDKERLEQVQKAIEDGVVGTQVEDLKQFTKSHALRLHKELMELTREQTIKDIIESKPDNYHLVTTVFEFRRMLTLMQHEPLIGLDTETTGLDPFGNDFIVGMSFTLPEADEHFYIPVRHNTEHFQLSPEMVFAELKAPLEDPTLWKVLFNARFDAHMFRKEDIKVQGIWMDGMISMHLLNENEKSFALKNLATKWGKNFGFEDKSATYEELFGKVGFQDTPLDIATVYACKDTHLTVNLCQWIFQHLKKQPRLMKVHNLESKVLQVVIEMEHNGFNLDMDFVKDYMEVLVESLMQLEEELTTLFGDVNLNSPDQLKKLLFTDLGLPDRNKGSVDANTLNMLKKEHKGIELLLKHRELSKMLGTYIEPLPKKVSPLDNRLHGQFKQTGTVTGRFSSSDPNLQNIPQLARKMFTAPEGRVLMGCDFSKVEPSILAHMSGDKQFQQPFLDGVDIYSSLASHTFHKPIEDCGDGTKERKMMKTGLLATMYGTSMWTLAEQLDITVEEAEQFIATFLNRFPVVAQWIDSVHDKVDKEGFVETMLGRKRRFIGHQKVAEQFKHAEAQVEKLLGRKVGNIWDEPVPYKVKQQYWNVAKPYFRTSRQSVNAIIQGTGADIMKQALVNVHELLTEWNSGLEDPDKDGFKIVATVHDEVLIEIPVTTSRQRVELIEEALKQAVNLSIPVKVDTELMTRWGEGIKKDKWFETTGKGC